jgi:hypothetical protein
MLFNHSLTLKAGIYSKNPYLSTDYPQAKGAKPELAIL